MKAARTAFNRAQVISAAQAAYPDADRITWKDDDSVWGTMDGKRFPLGAVQVVNEYGAVDFFPNDN